MDVKVVIQATLTVPEDQDVEELASIIKRVGLRLEDQVSIDKVIVNGPNDESGIA